jgi:hypothetical protein
LALRDRYKVVTHFKTCCVHVDPSGVLLGYPNLPSNLQGIYHPPYKMNWLIFVVDSYNKLLFQSVIQLIASV